MAQQTQQEVLQRNGYSLTVVALFLLILLARGLPLPQRAVTIVPIVVAAVVTVRELRRLHREDAPVVARFGPYLTLGFVGMLLLASLSQLAFYGPVKAYEDCMGGANTQAAQAACGQQRQQSVLGNLLEL